VSEACSRFLQEIGKWIDDCTARYSGIVPTDVHDQSTFVTGWVPYIKATGDQEAIAFMIKLRDAIKAHFTDNGLWKHGYWRMQEPHHGTEHFELFLGALLAIRPDDEETIEQVVDAAEHIGNWVNEVPPWFDWDKALFRAVHFGTDGIRESDNSDVNLPDHMRFVNISLMAFKATRERRFLDFSRLYAQQWAKAVLTGDSLPILLTQEEPVYSLQGTDEAAYRKVVTHLAPDLQVVVDRAENLLASNVLNSFLEIWHLTGEAVFRQATEKLLDILVTQLQDPDAGAVAAAVRRFRNITGDSRYDGAVVDAVSQLDPWAFDSLTLDASQRLPARPSGIGKRTDVLIWLEDDSPRQHNPILLAMAAEINGDVDLATRAVDIGRVYFELARKLLPDGREDGCAAKSVSGVARGHGRENHAGVVTAVLEPIMETFL
jgi:hypothetical protein